MSNNYFSNHSAPSRFLAISAGSSFCHVPARRRTGDIHIHFEFDGVQRADSGSGEGTGRASALDRRIAMGTGTTMRRRTVRRRCRAWVFWFRQQRTQGKKIVSFEDGIKRVAAFSSIKSLWALTTHLAPPSVLAPTTDDLLFHAAGVGGARVCRVGEAFAGCGTAGVEQGAHGESWEDDDAAEGKNGTSGEDAGDTDAPEICECTIGMRQSEDITPAVEPRGRRTGEGED
ncbi:translation initiation factor eIF4e [Mycena olivaceomarginata]|nr:translation initiation factor eIF4e [Mycena olivaceomarginata]